MLIALLLFFVTFFYFPACSQEFDIVIVVAEDAAPYVRYAANDLIWHLKQSTGKEYKILTDKEAKLLHTKQTIIAVGKSLATAEIEKEILALSFEEFLIKSVANKLIIAANDNDDAPAVHYGVAHFLEKTINAKWIWPGEEGTFFEKKESIPIQNWNYKWKSDLEERTFCSQSLFWKLPEDTQLWMLRHRLQKRAKYNPGHAFKDWENKYPDLVATDPRLMQKNNKQIKFKINNPRFLDVVVQDFHSSKVTGVYHIAPRDGKGFEPTLLPDKEPLKVWNGEYSVTQPYLEFWTALDKKINQPKKQTQFLVNIYSSYYFFPDNYKWDGKNFVLNYACKLYTFEKESKNWNDWKKTKATLILRPNWFGKGMFTCLANYDEQLSFFEFAKKNEMKGFFFDVFQSMWSTRGFQYYVLVRMSYCDKSLEEIKNEYYETFGQFGKSIKEYQNYCNFIYNKISEFDPQKGKRISGAKGLDGFAKFLKDEEIKKMETILTKNSFSNLTLRQKQAANWFLSGFELSKLTFEYSKNLYQDPKNKAHVVEYLKNLERLLANHKGSFDLKKISGIISKNAKSGYSKEDHKNQIWLEEENDD